MFYNPIQLDVGTEYTFWGFAAILVLTLILCIIFVPETKGKSLDDIQQMFRGNVSDDRRELVDNSVDSGNILDPDVTFH